MKKEEEEEKYKIPQRKGADCKGLHGPGFPLPESLEMSKC